MPNSHRQPDASRQSCPCRVWCACVNWTIATNVFGLHTSVGDSLELSGIQFTPPKRTRHRQDSFVVSGVAVWISFNRPGWRSDLIRLSTAMLSMVCHQWTLPVPCVRVFGKVFGYNSAPTIRIFFALYSKLQLKPRTNKIWRAWLLVCLEQPAIASSSDQPAYDHWRLTFCWHS